MTMEWCTCITINITIPLFGKRRTQGRSLLAGRELQICGMITKSYSIHGGGIITFYLALVGGKSQNRLIGVLGVSILIKSLLCGIFPLHIICNLLITPVYESHI